MLRIATGEVFESKFQDGAAEGKPYKVHLHFLTPEERDLATGLWIEYQGGNSKVSFAPVFKMGVKRFENLLVEIDGKEISIETPDDFLKYPFPQELYSEIAARIMLTKGLTVEDRKN
jgi:hypothetical protein